MPEAAIEHLSAEIAQLKQMISALTERLGSMEGAAKAPSAAPPGERIGEETLLAIAAAVAAYLGHKPKIKQVRLVRSGHWAQEGRVSIQASRSINIQR